MTERIAGAAKICLAQLLISNWESAEFTLSIIVIIMQHGSGEHGRVREGMGVCSTLSEKFCVLSASVTNVAYHSGGGAVHMWPTAA